MSRRIILALILVAMPLLCRGEDPVFSGPQPGETLAPFKVITISEEGERKEVDPIALSEGKPTLLIFVHKLTRPGAALTRGLTNYANKQEGAAAGVIYLGDDQSKAEENLTLRRKALGLEVPAGVSVDGGEGPGAYGLNRNVELTILVANENRVAANFALVQPSVTEGPKIVGELSKLLGQKEPTVQEFARVAFPGGGRMVQQLMQNGRNAAANQRGPLRGLMQKLIAADASEEQMREAIKEIETWVGDDKERQTQVARMAGAVLARGMGSPVAQNAIKGWQEKFGGTEE